MTVNAELGTALPELVTAVPGRRSLDMAERLGQRECSGITWLDPEGQFPVFWERARGANVWDVDGNRYIDVTAAFGVAACGHGHPELVAAAREQSERLVHGMGDVHPPVAKLELLEALAERVPGDLSVSVLGLNGADAVEAALKAAFFHTNKPGIIAFEGGYHGLLGWSLESGGQPRFKTPFAGLLSERTTVLPVPDPLRPPEGVSAASVGGWVLERVRRRLDEDPGVGAILLEPIQARGGCVVLPDAFLRGLRELTTERGVVLIFDEIFSGFGRTGEWFACEHAGVVPDIMTVGKALTGGYPLSAAIGTPDVMGSWPKSTGEAVHTSTFLGHPVACAVAVRSLALQSTLNLPLRAARSGDRLVHKLKRALAGVAAVEEIRGRGLLVGIDLVHPKSRAPAGDFAVATMMNALKRGLVLLPSGRFGNVVGLSPPITISEAQIDCAVDLVASSVREAVQ